MLFAAMFVLLVGYLSYSVYFYGESWFTNSHNTRLQTVKKSVIPGSILDRNGVVLAGADATGNRVYATDYADRLAYSHIVGDTAGMCPSGADTLFASHLLGFRSGVTDRLAAALQGEKRTGDNVYLTMDARLQRYAAALLDGHRGSIVLMNYETGAVYTLYSAPTFDPENIQSALDENAGGFLQRATQGQYAPGSTFKIITAAAALNADAAGYMSYKFTCTGRYETQAGTQNPVTCPSAHGALDLPSAFAVSCNCYFANLGVTLGEDALKNTANQLCFSNEFSFDDIILYQSTLGDAETLDHLGWMAIGQHKDVVTPMHMAMITSAIANGGDMMRPFTLEKTVTYSGVAQTPSAPAKYRTVLSPAIAANLKTMMQNVVSWGTGTRAQIDGYTVCGKTGTAEVSSNNSILPHAWFTGFLQEKPVCITVIVENSGSGGTVAAPIARQMLQKYLELGY